MSTKPKTFRHFSDADDARLLELLDRGLSHRAIGLEIGRSKSAIYSRIQTLRGARRLGDEDADDTGCAVVTVREPRPGVRIVTHRMF